MTNLQSLSITFGDPEENPGISKCYLGFLTNLTKLKIDGQTIFFMDDDLSKLVNLEYLQIENCDITDNIFKHLPKLQTLKIYYCSKISGVGFKHLNKLRTLRLRGSSVTSGNFKYLTHLQELNCECSKYNDRTFAHLTNLRFLSVAQNHQIRGFFVHYTANLKALNLSSCTNVTNCAIKKIAEMNSLEYLDLSNCNQITDRGIIYLLRLKKLRVLSLLNCNITDQYFFVLRGLHSLDITNISLITKNGLKYLTGLHTLILSPCVKVSKALIEKYLSNVKNLAIKHLYGCGCGH